MLVFPKNVVQNALDRRCSRCRGSRVSDFRPSEKLFLPGTAEEKITSEQHSLAQHRHRKCQPGENTQKYDMDMLTHDFTGQIFWGAQCQYFYPMQCIAMVIFDINELAADMLVKSFQMAM